MIILSGFAAAGYAEEDSPRLWEPVIGIAWRADTDSEFFTNICRAIEEADGTWIMLDQVKSAYLSYDDLGNLTDGVDEEGSLTPAAAKYVRTNTWSGADMPDMLEMVSVVIFTGGEDISSSLYLTPEPPDEIKTEIDYNAERDVSDYLTMSYCLDHDIPVMGFCCGMQMLSVKSGAEIIQDIPSYFASLSIDYDFQHRNEKKSPDSYRDYAPHSVEVAADSLLYDMVETDELDGCPSWHHQAVKNVDNPPLVISGYTDTNGIPIIEAVERTDKTFAVGLQFHPEAAVVKILDDAENKDDFLDYDTAMSIFEWLTEEIPARSENLSLSMTADADSD